VADDIAIRQRSAQKFDAVLASKGLPGRVVELSDSTRTAAEAARAVGCELRQIVKSLVFRGAVSGSPVLLLVSGANRVDETWMEQYTGERLARADPEFVRSVSGYAIGGVPPTGHATSIPTYIDYDLLELREVWAAAGHPHAVCRLTSGELLELTRGHPVSVTPLNGREPKSAPWVTFDCYGTLIDWRAGLLQQFEKLGGTRTPPMGDRLFRAYVEAEWRVEGAPYRPYQEVIAEAVVLAARTEGLEVTRSKAAEVPESIPGWPAFPDTRSALADLHRHGYRIGVLSNIDTELLHGTLQNLGVEPDLVVTAESVRSYKPAPPHWIRFLKETGAPPAGVWHVSASYEHDIAPARALGFRTVYVERYGGPPVGTNVGVSIPTLSDLERCLR
jgi:2-haloalkanoic acid dehalogenase type II